MSLPVTLLGFHMPFLTMVTVVTYDTILRPPTMSATTRAKVLSPAVVEYL